MTQLTIKFEVDIAPSLTCEHMNQAFQMFQLFKSGYPLHCCMRTPYSFHEIGVVPVGK